MTPRLWITALVCTALVAGAVGAAQALVPDRSEASGRATQVLARHVTRRAAVRAATTTTSASTSTTTTTLAHPAPGPLAQPAPATPVTFPQTTPAIDRVPTTDKVIFLGIDDGLVRDPAVLQLLSRERVPVTLFLVRGPAHDGQEYFRALQAVGATVQEHTITHPQMSKLPYYKQQHEACGDLSELQTWYGTRPTLFRPPYGVWNETTRAVVRSCGLHALILWRGATNDGRLDLVGGPDFHPGDILLLHFRKDLYENLQLVFARARAQGYKIGRLEDYLGVGPPHPMFSRPG
jgi:peptidoglycan/xylan/chitin deacetylase (PgdA/CDA1 family)